MTSILSILIEVKALDQEWWFNMHTAEIYFLRFFDDSRINFQEALKLYVKILIQILLIEHLSQIDMVDVNLSFRGLYIVQKGLFNSLWSKSDENMIAL